MPKNRDLNENETDGQQIIMSKPVVPLAAVALVLLLTMLFIGLNLLNQYQRQDIVLKSGLALSTRPISQLQREILRLSVLVEASEQEVDPQQVQFQIDLVESRFGYAQQPYIRSALNEEMLSRFTDTDQKWATLQDPLADWQADPTNESLQAILSQALLEMEFQVNDLVSQYEILQAKQISTLVGQSKQSLSLLGVVSLLLFLFVGLVAYSTYGFIQERKRAQEALQKAHDELEMRVEQRTADLQKSNQLLQEEISERQQAEEQLQASVQEKEVLLKEIHHRVKNNLQIISSLLYLQSKKIADPQALTMFQQSQNRVKSMALIHETLYQSKDLAHINFADYIHNLTRHLSRECSISGQTITIHVNADELFFSVQTAVPCGLIINELVSNALKHAFPKGNGEIRLDLSKHNQQLTLMVADNGVGFPQEVDWKRTRTLGLQLVNNLVRQLDGTIELHRHSDSENNGGTQWQVTFAEPQ
jgi:two-component sensor histidine kinase